MNIQQIRIQNFRNFIDCTIPFGPSTVVVGENKVGKSNLLHALRLVLDPRLPDSERQLKLEDFPDGLSRPLAPDAAIRVDVDFVDFDAEIRALALLAEFLVAPEPAIARISYMFRPRADLIGVPTKDSDYEFLIFGQNSPDCPVRASTRQFISLLLLPALRDAESALANSRTSPLAPLLKAATSVIDMDTLRTAANAVYAATTTVAQLAPLADLGKTIELEIQEMVGVHYGSSTQLGFLPTEPDKILKSLRLLIDGGRRPLGDASLGSANLIYLGLLTLELKRQVTEDGHCHTWLAIEEPEAHLHPHLQRLAFKRFLRNRSGDGGELSSATQTSVIVTTHSPHIVSVAPIDALVLLKDKGPSVGTVATSTRKLSLSKWDKDDLERYIDVTRGEILFARAIILVEGIAEVYVVKALAKRLGYDVDMDGISICSVEGVNFIPYVKLLDVLGIPFAVITDLDPHPGADPRGLIRVQKILTALQAPSCSDDEAFDHGESRGIFVNSDTLETELIAAGNADSIGEAIAALTENVAAKARAEQLMISGSFPDRRVFLSDIDQVGKGRLAQRAAGKLAISGTVPNYTP
jgi:putative ATP-dependent endonuclease of OLD family